MIRHSWKYHCSHSDLCLFPPPLGTFHWSILEACSTVPISCDLVGLPPSIPVPATSAITHRLPPCVTDGYRWRWVHSTLPPPALPQESCTCRRFCDRFSASAPGGVPACLPATTIPGGCHLVPAVVLGTTSVPAYSDHSMIFDSFDTYIYSSTIPHSTVMMTYRSSIH